MSLPCLNPSHGFQSAFRKNPRVWGLAFKALHHLALVVSPTYFLNSLPSLSMSCLCLAFPTVHQPSISKPLFQDLVELYILSSSLQFWLPSNFHAGWIDTNHTTKKPLDWRVETLGQSLPSGGPVVHHSQHCLQFIWSGADYHFGQVLWHV